MKKKIIGIFVCMLLIVIGVIPAVGYVFKESNENHIEKTMKEHPDFVPGEFFVKVSEGTTVSLSRSDNIMTMGIQSIDNLNIEFNIQNIEETFLNVIKKPKNPKLFESIGLDRIYTFFVDEEIDILGAVEAYDSDPHVEYAEPIFNYYNDIIPNDQYFNLQWGLHNTGQSGGTLDADINAPEAWDIETGDSSIVIAIVDSGIDWQHVDLVDRIWVNPGEDFDGDGVVGDYGDDVDNVDNDGNGFVDDLIGWDFYGIGNPPNNPDNNPMDNYGHGTHCAGIAGASTNNNNIGIAGVNWNCQLMALRAGTGGKINGTCSELLIIYAADNGAHVISMSWGSYDPPNPPSQTLKNAIDYAYGSGCVLVASMGNDNYGNSKIRYPAAFENVIAVGATDENDERCQPPVWPAGYGSCYGNHIDVVAPGNDIYSTLPGDKYDYDRGTSFAVPMVAGLAALLLAQDPSLSNEKIREIIRHTAEDEVGKISEDTPGFDQFHGYGRINAYQAVSTPYKPIKPSGTTQGKTGKSYPYSTSSIDPNGDKVKYGWDWDGDDIVDEWDDNNGSYYLSGTQVTTVHTWDTDGTYVVKVKSRDINDFESAWSDSLPVTMPKNKAFNFNFNMLEWLCERFLNSFLILRYILEFQ